MFLFTLRRRHFARTKCFFIDEPLIPITQILIHFYLHGGYMILLGMVRRKGLVEVKSRPILEKTTLARESESNWG